MALHRCGVCWQTQISHGVWVEHVVEVHGADIRDWNPCRGEPKRGLMCIGIGHHQKLPNEGRPYRPRARPEPQPFKAKDGTVYHPQRLF